MIEGLLIQPHLVEGVHGPCLCLTEEKTNLCVQKIATKTFQVAFSKKQQDLETKTFTAENLLKIINDPREDEDMRSSAIYLLPALLDPSALALKSLHSLTQQKITTLCLAATLSLYKWGVFTDNEKRVLTHCLSDLSQDVEDRALAMSIWAYVDPKSDELHQQLLALLKEEEEEFVIRELAIKLLLQLKPNFPKFMQVLKDLLAKEEEGNILYTAFLAYIQLQKDKSQALSWAFSTLQNSENLQLQQAALKALERFSSLPQKIRNFLKSTFNTPLEDETLRKAAFTSWLKIEKNPQQKKKAFLSLLKQEEYTLLADLDCAFPPSIEGVNMLLKKLKNTKDEGLKEAAVDILARLKPYTKETQQHLLSLALNTSTNFYLRIMCLRSLGEIGLDVKEEEKSLLSLVYRKDQAPEIRYQSLQTLVKILPITSPFFPTLLNIISNKKMGLEIREYAMEALCMKPFDIEKMQACFTQIVLDKHEPPFLRQLAMAYLQRTLAPLPSV